jgi:hypothetical protein
MLANKPSGVLFQAYFAYPDSLPAAVKHNVDKSAGSQLEGKPGNRRPGDGSGHAVLPFIGDKPAGNAAEAPDQKIRLVQGPGVGNRLRRCFFAADGTALLRSTGTKRLGAGKKQNADVKGNIRFQQSFTPLKTGQKTKLDPRGFLPRSRKSRIGIRRKEKKYHFILRLFNYFFLLL